MWLYTFEISPTKYWISTHTSRVGCDISNVTCWVVAIYFYSHIPCGMWHLDFILNLSPREFLLTHPVWDVTYLCHDLQGTARLYFYSHIPCGMWHIPLDNHNLRDYFYSHIPCGMWLQFICVNRHTFGFLLTHPVWDVTSSHRTAGTIPSNFYSHIPCGMWHIQSP